MYALDFFFTILQFFIDVIYHFTHTNQNICKFNQ